MSLLPWFRDDVITNVEHLKIPSYFQIVISQEVIFEFSFI